MTSRLEYHLLVRHSFPASVALLSLLALSLVFSSSASAQINGAPTSVTSPGFGGRAINGTSPSVTSLGPNGYGRSPGFPPGTGPGHDHRGRHHYVGYAPPLLYALPVPYAVDIGETDDYADADDRDPNYQGGPTIFDRRGLGADSYVPPVKDVPRPHAMQAADEDSSAAEAPQEPTLLVFRDGRKLEIGNYAIVGVTLFDLTPGHPRKVAIAELDLDATRKLNEEHGVIFQLPAPPQAN